MRRIIIFLLMFILLSVPKVLAANVYSYIWENTYIEVERYSNISNYTSLPRAKLMINNEEVSDANVTYNINGDWHFYLSDVDTTKVREYKVWYKANETKYRPGTCNNYKALITFKVVDKRAPEIISLNNNININLNDTAFDYLAANIFYIKCFNEYKVLIDDSKVNYYKVGTYPLIISVIDTYYNQVSENFTVSICDVIPPQVTFNDPKYNELILVEKAESYDFKKYLSSKTDDINNLNIEAIFDESLREKQKLIINIYDSNNNVTTLYTYLQIVDSIVPKITLGVGETISLSYDTNFNEDLFKRYVISVLDGNVDLMDRLQINCSSLLNKVGSYNVIYSVIDDDNNKCEKILKVNLVSYNPPIINCEKVRVQKGTTVILKDYINVIDDSDKDILNKIVIDDSTLDLNNEGTYYVKVTVINSSGLSSGEILEVEVYSLESNNFKLIIIIIIIVMLIGGIIYYFINKNKKKNTLDVNI